MKFILFNVSVFMFSCLLMACGGGTTNEKSDINPQIKPKINQSPKANADKVNTLQNVRVLIDVLVNDSDPENDALTVTKVTVVSGGTPTIENNKVAFMPTIDFIGNAQFTYAVSDGENTSAVVTVTITIEATENTPPVANDDNFNVAVNDSIIIEPLLNDSDVNDDILAVIAFESINPGVIELANNKITFTPAQDWAGMAHINYTVADGKGGQDEAVIFLKVIPVNAENKAPVVGDDYVQVLINSEVIIDVLNNDHDPEGEKLQTFAITEVSVNGQASILDESNISYISYAPSADFIGTDRLTYKVLDSFGNSGEAHVFITVVNNVPTKIVDDILSIKKGSAISIWPTRNDTSGSLKALALKSVNESQVKNGQIEILLANGQIDYTPNADFTGNETFEYFVENSEKQQFSGRIVINVRATEQLIREINLSQIKEATHADIQTSYLTFEDEDGDSSLWTMLGQDLKNVGDINNDGYQDLAISVTKSNINSEYFILKGSKNGLPEILSLDTLTGEQADLSLGQAITLDYTGSPSHFLLSPTDLNGDNIDEILFPSVLEVSAVNSDNLFAEPKISLRDIKSLTVNT